MKKFFKILMVFALLSGAALSCTKDYSKEIQDVQKQSQELQALITSLQNALNSTNASVAQLSKDVAGLSTKHKEDIDVLTKKASELEGKIETLKTSVEANAKDILQIQEIIGIINLTLKDLEKDIETNKTNIAANKALIEQNIADIATAQSNIKKLLEAVADLSARLTNIAAAPATVKEVQTITIGETVRTLINMDFIVTPAEAAKAIAAKYGVDPSLEVTYTLFNGLDRAQSTRAEEEKPYSFTATPHRIECLSDGVISVTAVFDEDYVDGEKSLYVTLGVSGADSAGEFERVSDPVKPIYDGKHDLLGELKWYKGNKAVTEATGDLETIAKELKKDGHEDKDTAFVQGQQLCIVAPDYDWKTLPKSNNDLIKGFELKWKVAETQVFTLEETAELLHIPFEMIAPHYTAGEDKKAFVKTDYAPVEWKDFEATEELGDTTVFTATGDIASLNLTLAVALKGTEPEQAEYVGAFTQISSNWIALGEHTNKNCNVNYIQRICKHVTGQEAADALHASFAFNASDVWGAEKSDTTFSSVVWKSTTSISRHGTAKIYVVKDGELTSEVNGHATVKEMQAQSKFVEVTLDEVAFAAEPQDLRIVWENKNYKNAHEVTVEVYTDYIDLSVDAFHAPVALEATADAVILSRTKKNQIPTDLTVKAIFEGDKTWFLNDEKAADPAQQGALAAWFVEHVNNEAHPVYADSIVPALDQQCKVWLTVDNTTGKIVVNAEENVLKRFVGGKDYKIYVSDTIDNVIAFNYVINFAPKKIGAKIETIPGFVINDSVYVSGSSTWNAARGVYEYRIDDINLTQYYRLANVDSLNALDKDVLEAKFVTKADVTFDKTPHVYGWTRDQEVRTYGVIEKNAKISWNGHKKNFFDLMAVATVDGYGVPEDSVKVRFWTTLPLTVVDNELDGEGWVGQTSRHNLFEDLDIRGIVSPETNLINCGSFKANSILNYKYEVATPDYGLKTTAGYEGPKVSDWKDWSCTVNGVPYPNDQMKELFASEPKWSDSGMLYHQTEYVLNFREHSAPGIIVFTIPCIWEYNIGTLSFDMVFTLVVSD